VEPIGHDRCTEDMRRQLAFSGLLALAFAALIAAPALAGGWAVTTVDPLPSSIQAGQTYDVGFTIRQHGQSPFNQATPRIRAELANSFLSFAATRDGDGHYVARVTFPKEGAWTWRVDQTPFATQELGRLNVVAATPAVEPVAAAAPASFEQGVLGYALAGLLAIAVLLWRTPLWTRRRGGVR